MTPRRHFFTVLPSLPERLSVQSVKRVVNPSLDNDTNVILPPPSDAAFADRVKVVERDVEIHWKNAQSV
jgi:hypothetical protein